MLHCASGIFFQMLFGIYKIGMPAPFYIIGLDCISERAVWNQSYSHCCCSNASRAFATL